MQLKPANVLDSCYKVMTNRRFIAEWEPQKGVLIAWPHTDTDWTSTLPAVNKCYRHVAQAITEDEHLIIAAPDVDMVREQLNGLDNTRYSIVEVPTNDTWARDFGPLTVEVDGTPTLLDFTFNAWGMKFAADKDNLITSRLIWHGALPLPAENQRDMVLEGGSVETDGRGTLLTTSECLLSPNRNSHWSRAEIERQLKLRLGVTKVLWLDHGSLPGDDTDSHIDTLARLAPGNTIVHITALPDNEEYREVQRMIEQLQTFTNADGIPFRLVPLPAPSPILDADGHRLPATYANYLVTNHRVLVPTYGQPDNDRRAIETLAHVFRGRKVLGIDCRPLIEQHGSLHCITMQLH